MSVTRTFTVTVSNPGSGNKYYIDSVLQDTVTLGETGTYKFDQADSSNSGHPFRFSTTSDGTHGGGSEYTTGVTTNGTPGEAGAYTQIVVAESAPTLYYYCANHSGMGGQADTVTDNTWGIFAWGNNEWNDQGSIDISLTAPSTLTSSVGSLSETTSNVEGWSRQEWGNSGWGVDYSVALTGVGATSGVGSVTATQVIPAELTGIGATSSVGSLSDDLTSVISLTAPSQLTSELGDFDNAGTLVGWGRNGWAEEPWGDSFNKLVQPSGLSMTSSVGAIAPADVMGLTGVGATSSVGSITHQMTYAIDGVGATSSVGAIVPALGDAISGVGATSSVGSISPADVVGLTGLGATSSVGELDVTPTELVDITAPSGLTISLGTPIIETAYDLSAPSALTASVGSISLDAMTVGVSGVSATISVGQISPIHYGNVTGTQSASYSGVTGTQSSSYSSVTGTQTANYSNVSGS